MTLRIEVATNGREQKGTVSNWSFIDRRLLSTRLSPKNDRCKFAAMLNFIVGKKLGHSLNQLKVQYLLCSSSIGPNVILSDDPDHAEAQIRAQLSSLP